MLQFRHVLCPVDFSDCAARGLAYAAAVARWHGAQLEVLHVVPTLDARLPPAPAEGLGEPWPPRERVIAEIERAVAGAGATDLEPRVTTCEGRVAESIADRARSGPADLLVLGTHGRSGFTRALLGSVTEKVLRQVPCPVLTVPPAAPPPAKEASTFKAIVCATDGSPAARRAVRYALELGRQAGGRVTFLAALEYVEAEAEPEPSSLDPCHPTWLASTRIRESLLEQVRVRLHEQLAGEPATGCAIDEVVVADRAYKAILRCAADVGADLIVMGAQGTSGLELMVYGSNTQHVLRQATCPVLTVKP